jgi:hypothetical protein
MFAVLYPESSSIDAVSASMSTRSGYDRLVRRDDGEPEKRLTTFTSLSGSS